MAELTFLFAQMGAGKTASLLSTAFHLRQAGQNVVVLTTLDRHAGQVTSRIGVSLPATPVAADVDLRALVLADGPVDVVCVDEAQFLEPAQVDQLASLVDGDDVEVYCYGLRADFTGTLFPGSARLFAIADRVEQLQIAARCWCARPATHNARTLDGRVVYTGAQVVVDDGSSEVAYEPLCRAHHAAGVTRAAAAPLHAVHAEAV